MLISSGCERADLSAAAGSGRLGPQAPLALSGLA
jgi:hypothetical protein